MSGQPAAHGISKPSQLGSTTATHDRSMKAIDEARTNALGSAGQLAPRRGLLALLCCASSSSADDVDATSTTKVSDIKPELPAGDARANGGSQGLFTLLENGQAQKGGDSPDSSFKRKSSLRNSKGHPVRSALRDSTTSRTSERKSQLRRSLDLTEVAEARLLTIKIEQRVYNDRRARGPPLVSLRIAPV